MRQRKCSRPTRPGAREHVATARDLARTSLQEARRSVWALRPIVLEREELAEVLERSGRTLTAATGIDFVIEKSGDAPTVSAEAEWEVLRIGQEAVANAVRHSGCRRITLRLDQDKGALRLEVEDDGKGGIIMDEAGETRSGGFGAGGRGATADGGCSACTSGPRVPADGWRYKVRWAGRRGLSFDSRQTCDSRQIEAAMAERRLRVLIAEDQAIVCDGLAALVGYQADMEVAGCAADGAEAVRLYQELRPDVTLMDLRMPRLGGVEAIEAIRGIDPEAHVLVLTTYDGDEEIYCALQAGACAYLSRMPKPRSCSARSERRRGGRHIPSTIAQRLADRAMSGPSLTEREVEVLRFVAAGLTNKEIASQLFIAEGTVKTHLNSIHEKLGVRDRTEAVMVAVRRGILQI